MEGSVPKRLLYTQRSEWKTRSDHSSNKIAGFPPEVVTVVCLHVTRVEVIENSCRFDDSRRITAAVRGYKSQTEDFGHLF